MVYTPCNLTKFISVTNPYYLQGFRNVEYKQFLCEIDLTKFCDFKTTLGLTNSY